MIRIVILFALFITLFYSCNRPIDIINTNDNIPPAVPSDVRISYAADGEIEIDWQNNSELDLSGYYIYRRTDSTNYQLIDFTTDDYIVDDSLNYNTIYYYHITAVDISNLESSPSNEVSAKPLNQYKPYPPRSISINARNWEDTISIYLSWTPSGETDIAGYNIYRSTNSSFSPDSSTFLTFTKNIFYSDTSNLSFYTNYYYIIKAIDKGGLSSDGNSEVNDEIFEIPQIIFPENNSVVSPFLNFKIKTIKAPAVYRIILQTNEFFGEIWSNTISSNAINDSLNVDFNANYINTDKYYYWRVITFSNGNFEPNSISRLYKFMIKQ